MNCKRILIGFLSALLLCSCNKDQDGNQDYINGYLKYRDLITKELKVVNGKDLFLIRSNKDNIWNDEYFLKVKTDMEGYFQFKLDDEFNKYVLKFKDSIAGVFYVLKESPTFEKKSKVSLLQETKQIIVVPDTGQNAIVISIRDSLTEAVIPKVTIRFFTDYSFAQSNNAAIATFNHESDEFGKLVKMKIPLGNYFIVCSKKVNDSTTLVSNIIPVSIASQDSLIEKTIYIK